MVPQAINAVFGNLAFDDRQQVIFMRDRATGLNTG